MQQKMLHEKFRYVRGIDETEYSKMVYERQEKLKMYVKLRSEGCTEATALEAIQTKRSTYYRWKKSYGLLGLAGLENESKRPHAFRKTKLGGHIKQKIYHLRIKYKLWGKEKI